MSDVKETDMNATRLKTNLLLMYIYNHDTDEVLYCSITFQEQKR
jgi:hypothetical protein